MIVKFSKEYLAQLYSDGKSSDKKYRFQPEIVKGYRRCIDTLVSAPGIEHLYQLHSLNYEALTGKKLGVSSIRINRQYRLEFTVTLAQDEQIITICTILDITNHYKR